MFVFDPPCNKMAPLRLIVQVHAHSIGRNLIREEIEMV